MKTRNGFVSNSSSSSFVLCADQVENIKDLKIEISLATAVRHIIKTEEELLKYFQDCYINDFLSRDNYKD